ncbi:hypothetical protein BYT27DRAFT_7253415 [Phlegmacium glaucopus]|nr:hypothetical protein BYT27DRAFT_7253415 [Phlegmacium glaucopus]
MQHRFERMALLRTQAPKMEKANTKGLNNSILGSARETMFAELHDIPNEKTNTLNIPLEEEEVLSPTPPEHHHHISKDVCHKVDVLKWLADNRIDPALKNFLPLLKDHLLSRLVEGEEVLRVNYTTYDARRAQDSLNPRTHGDVMVLSRDDAHPYWYARIVGIFHAMVMHTGPKSTSRELKKMDFLFVWWFSLDKNEIGGWKTRKLHLISFVPDAGAFGFVDPADIIRAVHFIPRFLEGRTKELLGPSFARSVLENDEDWVQYYVNMFVDRDMIMRFRGGGVGHLSTRAATDIFKNDRDSLDKKSQQSRKEPNMEEDGEDEMDTADSGGESEREEVDEEGQVSESELFDYGYQLESESEEEEEEEEEREAGEEDDTTIDELGTLGYADY